MVWVEGIDWEALPDGKIRCLHCSKVLEGKSGLGPHLSACIRKESRGETPSSEGVSEGETLPEEHDALLELLKDHGIKKGKAIADLLSYRSWDDYKALQEYLELSGVRPDRQKLILESWSQHRGSSLPLGLIERIRTVTPYQQTSEGILTREELLKVLNERDQKREKEIEIRRLKIENAELRKGNSNPQKGEIERLRQEIHSMQTNQIIKRLDSIERNPKTDNATVQGIKSLENTIRDFIGILNPANPLPKKQLEKGARTEIFEKISPEFVSES